MSDSEQLDSQPNSARRLCAGAIVLAGGQSRRMGQDKALLRLRGEAMLTRACRMAMGVSDRTMAITNRPEHESLLPQGCKLSQESDPQGPLVAFAQGLAQLDQSDLSADSWVLLLACDLPWLTEQDLVEASSHLAQLATTVDAYLPPSGSQVSGGQAELSPSAKSIRWEPLCGFYRLRCLGSLQDAADRGVRSFQRWLVDVEVAPLTVWPAARLLNCNRPQDWRRVVGEEQ